MQKYFDGSIDTSDFKMRSIRQYLAFFTPFHLIGEVVGYNWFYFEFNSDHFARGPKKQKKMSDNINQWCLHSNLLQIGRWNVMTISR